MVTRQDRTSETPSCRHPSALAVGGEDIGPRSAPQLGAEWVRYLSHGPSSQGQGRGQVHWRRAWSSAVSTWGRGQGKPVGVVL